MKHFSLDGIGPILVFAMLVGHTACSPAGSGSNPDSGSGPGSGSGSGSGSASDSNSTSGSGSTSGSNSGPVSMGTNTGNGAPACPAPAPCAGPVLATGPDRLTYRGRVWPDTTVASGAAVPTPPAAKLEFGGGEVRESDGACHDDWPNPGARLGVQIFIFAADSSIDGSGTLHVHGAPRDGRYASSPSSYLNNSATPGWAVDLTLTADGELAATLQYVEPSAADGASEDGGSDSGAGASSTSPDAGSATQTITIHGPIAPLCVPSVIPVSGGDVFKFPCWHTMGCDISKG